MSTKTKKSNKNKKQLTQRETIILLALSFVLIVGIICGSIIINKMINQDDSETSEPGIVDDLPDNFK